MKDSDPVKVGDYVLATAWGDGCGMDRWHVGFLGATEKRQGWTRFYLRSSGGCDVENIGFRAARRITKATGKWLLDNRKDLQRADIVLFDYLTADGRRRFPRGPKRRCLTKKQALETLSRVASKQGVRDQQALKDVAALIRKLKYR
jgi:hypothetical protein